MSEHKTEQKTAKKIVDCDKCGGQGKMVVPADETTDARKGCEEGARFSPNQTRTTDTTPAKHPGVAEAEQLARASTTTPSVLAITTGPDRVLGKPPVPETYLRNCVFVLHGEDKPLFTVRDGVVYAHLDGYRIERIQPADTTPAPHPGGRLKCLYCHEGFVMWGDVSVHERSCPKRPDTRSVCRVEHCDNYPLCSCNHK